MKTKQTYKQMYKQSIKRKRKAYLIKVVSTFSIAFLLIYGMIGTLLLINELLKYLGIIPNH